jgi:hypothetical protein
MIRRADKKLSKRADMSIPTVDLIINPDRFKYEFLNSNDTDDMISQKLKNVFIKDNANV